MNHTKKIVSGCLWLTLLGAVIACSKDKDSAVPAPGIQGHWVLDEFTSDITRPEDTKFADNDGYFARDFYGGYSTEHINFVNIKGSEFTEKNQFLSLIQMGSNLEYESDPKNCAFKIVYKLDKNEVVRTYKIPDIEECKEVDPAIGLNGELASEVKDIFQLKLKDNKLVMQMESGRNREKRVYKRLSGSDYDSRQALHKKRFIEKAIDETFTHREHKGFRSEYWGFRTMYDLNGEACVDYITVEANNAAEFCEKLELDLVNHSCAKELRRETSKKVCTEEAIREAKVRRTKNQSYDRQSTGDDENRDPLS